MRCSYGATDGWLTMVFVAYAYLLSVRLHFTYSMMVTMAEPLVTEPADREPCPDAVVNVGRNSTTAVARRLRWTPGQQAAAMGAYFAGVLASAFPGGVYANRGNERSMMLWCVAVTAAAVALVPIAFGHCDSWTAVAFLRFVQGFGYLYSFITTAIPIYGAKVLGGDAVKNGLQVSVPWLICWVTSILAGISATLLTNANTLTKTTVRKLYASIVLILSPLMLLGVMIAKCDDLLAKNFMRLSVILLGFERSSFRINSLDLCPSHVGSLMALCDVFYSVGNIMDSVIARSIFPNTFSWKVSFLVAIFLPIMCSIPFLLFGTSKRQCWDETLSNRQQISLNNSHEQSTDNSIMIQE